MTRRLNPLWDNYFLIGSERKALAFDPHPTNIHIINFNSYIFDFLAKTQDCGSKLLSESETLIGEESLRYEFLNVSDSECS